MFSHPGFFCRALEYAGADEETRKRYTMESLKRKSAASMQDENSTPPTTAGTQPTGHDPSPTVHFIDELGCQQRRTRRTFRNHTPRTFETRSSSTVEVYRPSMAFKENYSRPRTSHQSGSVNDSLASTSPHPYTSPPNATFAEKHSSARLESPSDHDSIHVAPPSPPEVYQPSTRPHRRSLSVPLARVLTYEPSPAVSLGQLSRSFSSRTKSSAIARSQEKKRQRRQTPFKVTSSSPANATRHAPLEPLVAEHRRKASHDVTSEMLPPIDTDQIGEIGTFGIIQRYFDSQTGGPVAAPDTLCHARSPTPSNVPLPVSPTTARSESVKSPIAIYPIDELYLPDELPPTVPNRSPKRITNPAFPLHTESSMSMNSEDALAARKEYPPFDKDDDPDHVLVDGLYVPKKRTTKRIDVGQADRAGSSQVGRLAPPILSHDALTASADLGLNDLSFWLKHTGPPADPPPSIHQRRQKMKLFKVKQRKTLAARVGSVEGSPERVRRRAPIPTCAREMTTSGGARHLRIIIPTESPRNTLAFAGPLSGSSRRSRHVSITFTEEMLNPLASPNVERIISDFEPPSRSFTEPVLRSPRCARRLAKLPKAVPVVHHPLATPEPSVNGDDHVKESEDQAKSVDACLGSSQDRPTSPEQRPETPVLHSGTPERHPETPRDKISSLDDQITAGHEDSVRADQEAQASTSREDRARARREEQTKARKLRDLQRIKRKPLPTYCNQKEQHTDTVAGALPTPAPTPEPLQESVPVDSAHEVGTGEESAASKMARMQEQFVLLQRQNAELREALAKIVGLDLGDGDLNSEEVLKALRQVKFTRQ